MVKPWTWEEIAEMEKERGPRLRTFLRNYGTRGSLAAELSRKRRTKRYCTLVWQNGVLIYCDVCPLLEKKCTPWNKEGRKNLTDWYLREIKKRGRLP
jgi:hypothetical protein